MWSKDALYDPRKGSLNLPHVDVQNGNEDENDQVLCVFAIYDTFPPYSCRDMHM